MNPPIFATIAASTAVKNLIGSSPVRFYLFGQAPQKPELPYVVWQQIGGSPENYLGGTPDIDSYNTQIDVYANTPAEARNVAEELRDAIETVAYVIAWTGDSRDPETQHFRYSFDVDWLTPR
jgi:hypothetical protein